MASWGSTLLSTIPTIWGLWQHCELPVYFYFYSCFYSCSYSQVSVLDQQVVSCWNKTCHTLTWESWQESGLTSLESRRYLPSYYTRYLVTSTTPRYHTTATSPNGILLVGGSDSPDTTELLSCCPPATQVGAALPLPCYSGVLPSATCQEEPLLHTTL